jgi:hypothetical protein
MPCKNSFASTISSKALAIGSFIPAMAGATFLFASPASAQSVCVTTPGVIIDCTPAVPGPAGPVLPPSSLNVDLTGSPDPITVTLADGFVSNGPVTLGTIAGADVAIVSEGVSTIQSTGAPGLVIDSAGGINAEVTNITTAGDGATGALLRAADEIVFTSDGTISTTGADADGVDAEGETVTLDLNNVTTTGPSAAGVDVGTLNGPASVTFNAINTSGDGSLGAIVTSTGDTTLEGNLIRTQGTDAAAFSITNDAAACVVLGAGGCDNTVTVDEVTTDGFGSTGGIVSSVGDTDVTIGVLRTGGDEAAGLSLSADPASCAVLGTGACDTAFTVNDLATAGDRSPGAVVRGAGDISADVGVLRTAGDEAVGLDLASDPTACAVLGAGGCDTSFSVGQLTTSGDGATGILVRSAGDTSGNVGVLRTQGDDAAGIDIAGSPTACVIAGAGACDVDLTAQDVSTQGDGAGAVVIDTPGRVLADLGRIRTLGAGSAGLGITSDPAACLALGAGSCTVQAAADDVGTSGPNSPGIEIDGGNDPVTVDAGTVVTTGANSNGIDVATVDGDIAIAAGPVRVSGVGSDAIVAASVCGDIAITARDDIVSAQGRAIVANSTCGGVTVTSLAGAPVSGALAGIEASSATGARINIGDLLTATNGPALDVDGAGAATVTIAPTGTIAGAVDLTAQADTLNNNGVFAPTAGTDFGAGADLLVNAGTLRVRGTPLLAGLESAINRGVIDMVDGAPDDVLTLPGDYSGQAGARLAIDVAAGTNGTPADRLVIGGNASGTTAVSLNLTGGPAVLNPTGALIVDAGTAASGAFTLAGPVRSGFVDYSLAQQGGDFRLLALPNDTAIEPLRFGTAGLDFWYQSADAWSEAAALSRGGDRTGIGFWAQLYGSQDKTGDTRDVTVFGAARSTNLRYETERRGAQSGIDFNLGPARIGVTGGYQHARSDFASGTEADFEGYNVGGYLLFGGPTGLYAELLGKADFFDVRIGNGDLFAGGEIDGKSYGAEGEIGWRMGLGGANLDLGAGLAYVRTDLDPLATTGFRFDFDRAESLRGRLGLRVAGTGSFAPYVDVKVLREFRGDNETSVSSGGFTYDLADRGRGTWFRGELGLAGAPGQSGGFVSAWAETGDVKGYGVRLGFRF